jgi:UDP-N-acetylmuramoyl-L-alanyl-D-glutamate--2,6-diaminopimelate ligase
MSKTDSVPFAPKFKAKAAALVHGKPAKGMQIVFVVGQDGALSSINYLASILGVASERIGIITSQYVSIASTQVRGSDKADVMSDIFRLQSLLAHMRRARCKYAVIEVPNVLPKHHFVGIKPTVVVVRRCGDEYLDNTSNAVRLSIAASLLGSQPEAVVLNQDDPCIDDLIQLAVNAKTSMTFGSHRRSECRVSGARLHADSTEIDLLIDHHTKMSLVNNQPGQQAVYDCLAAVSTAYLLHIPIEAIEQGINETAPMPNSMQSLILPRPFRVVVDASSTPAGVVETLQSLKHFTKNRLIVVLGAPLGVLPNWRAVIGEQVAGIADRLIVCDGEFMPNENAAAIRGDFTVAAIGAGAEAYTEEIADRGAAIEKALGIARRGDVVAVLATTCRPYRQIGKERQIWDDRQTVEQILSK